MEFTLKIELGNDAMLTPYDISCALEDVSKKLREDFTDVTVIAGYSDEGRIYDVNGNKVGRWEVSE